MPPLNTSSLKLKLLRRLKETQARYTENKLTPNSFSASLPNCKSRLKKRHPSKHKANKSSSKQTVNATPEEKRGSSKVESLTPLQQEMALKLQGAKFRWLNEQLYTLDSVSALDLIRNEPELYDIYHQGFRDQSQQWPVHPITWILSALHQTSKDSVIADLGCGDAKIATTLMPKGYTVHSFDLLSKHPFVTQATMTDVPLPDSVCDEAVYCLSLMNTDYAKAIDEGNRILKQNGRMHIIEVVSRISDLDDWIQSFDTVGLQLTHKKTDHPFFVYLVFTKSAEKKKSGKSAMQGSKVHKNQGESRKQSRAAEGMFPILKPCIYKRR